MSHLKQINFKLRKSRKFKENIKNIFYIYFHFKNQHLRAVPTPMNTANDPPACITDFPTVSTSSRPRIPKRRHWKPPITTPVAAPKFF